MTHAIRLFMLFETATVVVASAIHFGALIAGYEDQAAGIAEGVIAAVLLGGAALTWIRPAWLRRVGLAAQAFALLATSVGIFTTASSASVPAPCRTLSTTSAL